MSRVCSIEWCDGKHASRGWCSKNLQRWQAHGDPLYYKPKARHLFTQFMDKVLIPDDPDECWGWTGDVSGGKGGYASLRVPNGKRGGGQVSAHRVSMSFAGQAPLPESLVLHHCDNRVCTNPKHLYFGSHSQNHIDAVLRNRTPRKLTNDDVIDIRERYADDEPLWYIAARHGITEGTAQRVAVGVRYAHLPGAVRGRRDT